MLRIEKAAVLGAGTMGAQIAAHLANAGIPTLLLDNVLPTLSSPLALVCGSREMIEHTRDRLRQMGLPPEAILTNY